MSKFKKNKFFQYQIPAEFTKGVIFAYKDKPLKLGNLIPLKITHLKYYVNRMSLTYSSRPMIPPPLKRLVKAVGLRSVKTRCGAPYVFFAGPYF